MLNRSAGKVVSPILSSLSSSNAVDSCTHAALRAQQGGMVVVFIECDLSDLDEIKTHRWGSNSSSSSCGVSDYVGKGKSIVNKAKVIYLNRGCFF